MLHFQVLTPTVFTEESPTLQTPEMAPPRRKQSVQDKVLTFLSSEYNDPAKFNANLKLTKALGVFLGAVVVFRNFGEVLFAV